MNEAINRATLGRMIREERLKLEMTQDEFGQLIDTDKKKISRLERGMQFPDEMLIKVLQDRGVDVSQIMETMWSIRRLEEGTRRFGAQAISSTAENIKEDLTSFRDMINFVIPALSKEIRELREEIKHLRTELSSPT